MKILFVHRSQLGVFGEAAIHYYPAELASIGCQVGMIALKGGDASFLIESGVRVYEMDASEDWLTGVCRLVADEQPDIVHVYLYSGCGLIPWLARCAENYTRFVLDIRSPLLRTGVMRWLHRCKNLLEPMLYDAVASHGIESAWTQIGHKKNIYWLPPGIDLKSTPSPRIVLYGGVERGHVFRLVYIGSLDAIRRVDVMLDAVISLLSMHPISLDVYGNGNLRDKMKEKVADAGLQERIVFMGRVDRAALLSQLSKYDFGLSYIPRGIYDTAPALKTMEYLACGLPVLATDTFGNRMFVKNGDNGLLVQDDAESYASGIAAMLDQKRLLQMRVNTRTTVEPYDWNRMVRERLLPMYAEITDRVL